MFPPSYFALWDFKAYHRPTGESVSWCLETSVFNIPFQGQISIPTSFCLSFYLLYFVLPPVEDNGLPFWVPDVLYQHSEVVLWNLLSVQMFFRWICGGESGLPVLFFRHLSHWLSLLFSVLSRLVITFLPRRKHLLISWLQSPSAVILEPPKINDWIYSSVNKRTDSSSILTDRSSAGSKSKWHVTAVQCYF